MDKSIPQIFYVADILRWYEHEELVLNPAFQRNKVWSNQAKVYFIDSILNGFPIPKFLVRNTIDRDTRKPTHDVVDGQQRLSTIIEFSNGTFGFGTHRAKIFGGSKYASLSDELKDKFLGYGLTFETLSNATDDDIFEIYVRMNSYALPLTSAELRNARFHSEFSDLVKETVTSLGPVWATGIVSDRDRLRMVDQTLVAEGFAFLSRGVTNGSEADINKFYKSMDGVSRSKLGNPEKMKALLLEATTLMNDAGLKALAKRPHFLMLLAAVMYKKNSLPEGKLSFKRITKPKEMLLDREKAINSLSFLEKVFKSKSGEAAYPDFWGARETTQNIKSRQIRFEYFCRALAGEFAK